MIPQDCLNAITTAFPCPAASGFDRAFWLFECRDAVRWIAGFINEEYQKQIAEILENGITSDTYEIIPLQKPESRVRLALMREKYPDEFRELVYIKASDASKILGKKTLYNLAKEKAGEEVLLQLEKINVGDVEKTMLKEQAAELIETRMKTTDWAVLERERMKTWRDIEHLRDRTALQILIEEEKTPIRIARRLGCSRESVKNAMKHHGLSTKKYKIGDDMRRKLRL